MDWVFFSFQVQKQATYIQPSERFADIYVWLFAFCLNVQISVLKKNKNLHTFPEIFINFRTLEKRDV